MLLLVFMATDLSLLLWAELIVQETSLEMYGSWMFS